MVLEMGQLLQFPAEWSYRGYRVPESLKREDLQCVWSFNNRGVTVLVFYGGQFLSSMLIWDNVV